MRAVVCHRFCDYHDLRVEDFPEPGLPPRGVRIAVEFASLSFSISLWIAGKYQVKPPLPFVPGAEIVGRVLETAPGVAVCRPGQRVLAFVGWGGYAEQAVSHESTVYPLPEEIDSAAALHLGISYCTAYGALVWRANLTAGETLLVLAGAGGAGLAAVEVGRAMGARIIAAAGGAGKCAIARDHGAHATIDYQKEELSDAVHRLMPGQGLNVVFDPVGGSLSEAALRSLRLGGRLVSIGFASGSMPQIQPNLLLVKNVSLLGFNFGAYVGWSPVDERERYEPQVRAIIQRLFEWYAQGNICPLAAGIYPLERFTEALDALLGRSTVGKVALRVAT
ncbi:MAG: NADPH:quinone oxidoreductase family protein [Xanthobacteraceae bacterium]|nr:MAG: NADPH:quinone oxidoreductase family protein [Xanthobacteraceae bacterium]